MKRRNIRQKGFAHLFLLVIAVIIGIGAIGYLAYQNTQSKRELPSLSRLTPISISDKLLSPTISQRLNKDEIPEEVFVSENLGIKFTYATLSDSTYKWPISFIQSGKLIQEILHHPKTGDTVLQWIEVFDKQVEDNLPTAIKKNILTGYSEEDCQIIPKSSIENGMPNGPEYSYAQIRVPTSSHDDMEDIFEKAKKCPDNYTSTNFIAYFLYNPKYPDRFIFISLGQNGGTMLKNGKTWWQTIEFL